MVYNQGTFRILSLIAFETVNSQSEEKHMSQSEEKSNSRGKHDFVTFFTAIWLFHGQLRTILDGTTSLTRC